MGTQIRMVPVEWADDLADRLEHLLNPMVATRIAPEHLQEMREGLQVYRDRTAELADILEAAPAPAGPPESPERAQAEQPAAAPDPSPLSLEALHAGRIEPERECPPPTPDERQAQAEGPISETPAKKAHDARRREESARERAKTFLAAGGPASPKAIREHLGFPPRGNERVKLIFRELADDPDVAVTGKTQSRRYRLTDAALNRRRIDLAHAVETNPRGGAGKQRRGMKAAKVTGPPQGPTLAGEILSACSFVRPTLAELIATLNHRTPADVDAEVQALIADHELEAYGDSPRRYAARP